MSVVRHLLLMLALLTVTACASGHVAWRSPRGFDALPADVPVRLYLAPSAPGWLVNGLQAHVDPGPTPDGAERVAEIEVTQGPLSSWSTTVKGIRDSARELGADAAVATSVVGQRESERSIFVLLMRESP